MAGIFLFQNRHILIGQPIIISPASQRLFAMGKLPDINTETYIACLVILLGSLIMLVSIFKFRKNIEVASAIPKQHHKRIALFFALHQALMGFFFCCYIVVLLLFAFRVHVAGQFFVSAVFFLGAVFVLTGITIQYRLLSEIERTISGLLPICSICKKIRADGPPNDSDSWKNIETYLAEKSEIDFSHGLCPDCFQHELVVLNKEKEKRRLHEVKPE